MAEAVEWVKRCPNPMFGPSEIEIRPVYEMSDFADVVTPELAELLRPHPREDRGPLIGGRALPGRRALKPAGRADLGMPPQAHHAIETVFRIERARLIAGLDPHGARRRAAPRSSPRTRWSPRSPSGRGPACRAIPAPG